jgi:phage portal protein BeeE
MKSQIIDLLTTTKLNYSQIASKVGCSEKYIRQIEQQLRQRKYETNKRSTTKILNY